MGVRPCEDYVVRRKGSGRIGEKGERGRGRGTRHWKEGRGDVKYSKTRCMNGREKTRHDVYEYRPDQYNKGSPASASVHRRSFFFRYFSRNILQRMGATLCYSVMRNRLATVELGFPPSEEGQCGR